MKKALIVRRTGTEPEEGVSERELNNQPLDWTSYGATLGTLGGATLGTVDGATLRTLDGTDVGEEEGKVEDTFGGGVAFCADAKLFVGLSDADWVWV